MPSRDDFQWVYDNVDNASLHMMEDYLYWCAAKYINKKETGRNVPTNALTANLKANPLLFHFLFRTEKSDMKKMLQSFRYQKRATYTEFMNYKLIIAALYSEDDTLERIKTSKVVSDPKTLSAFKDLKNSKEKYLRNIKTIFGEPCQ